MSECWRFYAVRTARVIFTAKTCLDVFSVSQEQVWTFSVLGDCIYEMRCPFVAGGYRGGRMRGSLQPRLLNYQQSV